jgi:DNA-nicking Smr family endonuclease
MRRFEAVTARRPIPDGAALFRAAMHDVKPLRRRSGKIAKPESGGTAADGALPPRKTKAAAAAMLSPAAATATTAKANPGIDRRTAERLRKGEMAIERRIDLHGMTQDHAHATLDRFIATAWGDGKRMLLVITGKGSIGSGGGILRRSVPRWLAAGDHAVRVLRIETAQPRHGGDGALYVLLRRQRDVT